MSVRAVAAVAAWLLGGGAAAAPLSVVEVAPGVFVHAGAHEEFSPDNAGGIANLGFIVGQRSVAVVDSGGSAAQGSALLEAVRGRTGLPVSHVVNTHVHPDHLFGNRAFAGGPAGEGAAVVGHAKLARRLAEAGPFYLASLRRLLGPAFAGTEPVPPTLPVAERATIDLGGRTLAVQAWPTAHTDTDLTVLDEATGTLFAGDLLFMERIPVVDGSLIGWVAVMAELARLPAARVVPGHGPPSAAWPGALAAQRAYLEGLRDAVRAALARNHTLEQAISDIPPPAGHAWRLAAGNHERNVTASFTELEWE